MKKILTMLFLLVIVTGSVFAADVLNNSIVLKANVSAQNLCGWYLNKTDR